MNVKISLYDTYQKSAHLNRTVLSGANGIIKLNIPLIGGREQRLPMSEVRVDLSDNWRKIHHRSLISSYKRSPWFDHFADDLTDYFKNDFAYLWEWNITSVRWILRRLKFDLQVEAIFTRQPAESDATNANLLGTSNDARTRPYPQVFEDRFGFIPGLSILDTLFCLGPKSTREYITSG